MVKLPHIGCFALAGTGKTTTASWGLGGNIPKGVTMSEEQEAIVTLMRKERVRTRRMVAYNKSAAEDIATKVPMGVETSTFHSLGYQTLRSKGLARKMDKYLIGKILEDHMGVDVRFRWSLLKSVEFLCDKVRDLGLGTWNGTQFEVTEEVLRETAFMFNHDVDAKYWAQVVDLVPKVLTHTILNPDVIDFGGMIWLCVILGIEPTPCEFAVVDEAQDMNFIRRKFSLSLADRVMFIGDRNQAIYGWLGADRNSMDNFVADLEAKNTRGVECLSLTMTRRCCKAVVKEAQQYVPNYRAHPDSPEGEVLSSKYATWFADLPRVATVNNMILCRNNAPLVGLAYSCIRNNIPAYVAGRDFGAALGNFVRRFQAKDIGDLQYKLDSYEDKERQRIDKQKWGKEESMLALDDKIECISVMMRAKDTPETVAKGFEELFKDTGKGLRLSSAHRSKGLEAQEVSIYRPELLPHPSIMKRNPDTHQEHHLAYVAITRAIKKLTYVQPAEKSSGLGELTESELTMPGDTIAAEMVYATSTDL